MNGCVYCTKDNECDLWTDDKHKSFCDPDCKDKHPSNADRIRNMTDEELANIIDTDWCAILCNDGVSTCNADCHTKILEWLKQEVDT